ncbi:hypothetical protein [Arcobacter sp. F2176]|uniref:hypothetical protein n=1 Tax=Arcobacter sp. F2176 TaxID=2044511 RepID=UPI00100AD19E|nr:hypothetical protein [Arcobacter sp. F2176]RXJ82180.1 hypothetical protein CRU95_04645 [Arcobacter sp. F2176]
MSEQNKTICPKCQEGIIQREKDPVTKAFKALVCSKGHYDKESKSYVGCDFKFNLKVPLLKDFSLTSDQCKKLIAGDELIIQGKRLFIDIFSPNQVKAKGSDKMINFYLKVENLEGERDDF